MKFIPLGDRIVIEPYERKAVSAGGLIIPEKAQKDEGRGIVQGVSQDIKDPSLQVGDHVLYNVGTASPIVEEGQTLHVVPYHEISCKIDADEQNIQ